MHGNMYLLASQQSHHQLVIKAASCCSNVQLAGSVRHCCIATDVAAEVYLIAAAAVKEVWLWQYAVLQPVFLAHEALCQIEFCSASILPEARGNVVCKGPWCIRKIRHAANMICRQGEASQYNDGASGMS
jgi:hypothetical protein